MQAGYKENVRAAVASRSGGEDWAVLRVRRVRLVKVSVGEDPDAAGSMAYRLTFALGPFQWTVLSTIRALLDLHLALTNLVRLGHVLGEEEAAEEAAEEPTPLTPHVAGLEAIHEQSKQRVSQRLRFLRALRERSTQFQRNLALIIIGAAVLGGAFAVASLADKVAGHVVSLIMFVVAGAVLLFAIMRSCLSLRSARFPIGLLFSARDSAELAQSVFDYITALLAQDRLLALPPVYAFLELSALRFRRDLGPSLHEGFADVQPVTRYAGQRVHTCSLPCCFCSCALTSCFRGGGGGGGRRRAWLVVKPHVILACRSPSALAPLAVVLLDRGASLRKDPVPGGGSSREFVVVDAARRALRIRLPSVAQRRQWTHAVIAALRQSRWARLHRFGSFAEARQSHMPTANACSRAPGPASGLLRTPASPSSPPAAPQQDRGARLQQTVGEPPDQPPCRPLHSAASLRLCARGSVPLPPPLSALRGRVASSSTAAPSPSNPFGGFSLSSAGSMFRDQSPPSSPHRPLSPRGGAEEVVRAASMDEGGDARPGIRDLLVDEQEREEEEGEGGGEEKEGYDAAGSRSGYEGAEEDEGEAGGRDSATDDPRVDSAGSGEEEGGPDGGGGGAGGPARLALAGRRLTAVRRLLPRHRRGAGPRARPAPRSGELSDEALRRWARRARLRRQGASPTPAGGGADEGRHAHAWSQVRAFVNRAADAVRSSQRVGGAEGAPPPDREGRVGAAPERRGARLRRTRSDSDTAAGAGRDHRTSGGRGTALRVVGGRAEDSPVSVREQLHGEVPAAGEAVFGAGLASDGIEAAEEGEAQTLREATPWGDSLGEPRSQQSAGGAASGGGAAAVAPSARVDTITRQQLPAVAGRRWHGTSWPAAPLRRMRRSVRGGEREERTQAAEGGTAREEASQGDVVLEVEGGEDTGAAGRSGEEAGGGDATVSDASAARNPANLAAAAAAAAEGLSTLPESLVSLLGGTSSSPCFAQWFASGAAYMAALCDAVEQATSQVCLADWWLCPTLYLRRPPSEHPESRLDRLLLRKARQGVRIHVQLFREVALSLPLASEHALQHLSALHPNILVIRHRDGLYWSHHEKLAIVDQRVAFVGGIDLAFGRWDTPARRLLDPEDPGPERRASAHVSSLQPGDRGAAEAAPPPEAEHGGSGAASPGRTRPFPGNTAATWTDRRKVLFPGKDFSNPRVCDFEDVADSERDMQSRGLPRMPWHDVQVALWGAAVADVMHHFVQRWNYTVTGGGAGDMPLMVPRPDGPIHPAVALADGTADLQVLGQSACPHMDGSDAWQGARAAKGVDDGVGIVERALCRAEWPMGPHAPAAVPEDALLFGDWINAARSDETDGQGCGDGAEPGGEARSTERTAGHPISEAAWDSAGVPLPVRCQVVRSVGGPSLGVLPEHSVHEAYVRLIESAQHCVYLENQFFISGVAHERQIMNRVAEALVARIRRAAREGSPFRVVLVLPLLPAFPGDLNSASGASLRAVMYWQLRALCHGAQPRGGGAALSFIEQVAEAVPDWEEYVAVCGLRAYDRGAVASASRGAQGREDERDGATRDGLVTEQVYTHAKLCIIDDRITIIGSANVNDRSMAGVRDSEVAVVVEDVVTLPDAYLGGRAGSTGRFGRSLRTRLLAEHCGVPMDEAEEQFGDLAGEGFQRLKAVAAANTVAFEHAFFCLPSNDVRTVAQRRRLESSVHRVAEASRAQGPHVAASDRSVGKARAVEGEEGGAGEEAKGAEGEEAKGAGGVDRARREQRVDSVGGAPLVPEMLAPPHWNVEERHSQLRRRVQGHLVVWPMDFLSEDHAKLEPSIMQSNTTAVLPREVFM